MGDKTKMFSTRLPVALIKKLRHLSVDTDKPHSVLIQEAIKDLLKKYDKKSK
jgi:predicted DNA-binding protein